MEISLLQEEYRTESSILSVIINLRISANRTFPLFKSVFLRLLIKYNLLNFQSHYKTIRVIQMKFSTRPWCFRLGTVLILYITSVVKRFAKIIFAISIYIILKYILLRSQCFSKIIFQKFRHYAQAVFWLNKMDWFR